MGSFTHQPKIRVDAEQECLKKVNNEERKKKIGLLREGGKRDYKKYTINEEKNREKIWC